MNEFKVGDLVEINEDTRKLYLEYNIKQSFEILDELFKDSSYKVVSRVEDVSISIVGFPLHRIPNDLLKKIDYLDVI